MQSFLHEAQILQVKILLNQSVICQIYQSLIPPKFPTVWYMLPHTYTYAYILCSCMLMPIINVIVYVLYRILLVLRMFINTLCECTCFCIHTVHTSYNLNGTRRGHVNCTCMFLSYTHNYMHYQLPSCLGLHASSPPFCITRTRVCWL